MRRYHGLFRPSGTFFRHQFSADYTISMFGFDFRQGQASLPNPLQQLWREHLLAQSMIDNGLYDEGYFVTIAPALNYHVQDAAEAYQAQLREPEDGKVRFVNPSLEDVIEVIRLSDPAHAEALHHRY